MPLSKLLLALLLLAVPAEGADKISALFARYNPQQAEEIAQTVRDTAKNYDVNPNIIASIIVHESGVRPHAVSKGGDYGLMQVRWKVHRSAYPELKTSPSLLFDPAVNIRIGTEIFARYYAKKDTIKGALLRYSGGNNAYANKVLRTFKELENGTL